MVRVIQFAGCGSSSSTGVISGGGIREFYEWGAFEHGRRKGE